MIYNNLLLRTLVGYRDTAGQAGIELVPDLATEIPEPTDGGLKYTFTLKDGVKFGPPVNRAVSSKDIAYAIERIGTPSVVAQYPGYYTAIKGFSEFAAGKAKTISGIQTPDDKTISFTLTKPTGDFLFRLALPAAAPIPAEVAKCHTQAGEYGRFVISTGPYMYEGADKLDISSCASQKPISGYAPGRSWTMVRNPNYDPATDDPSIREALPGQVPDHGQHQPRRHLREDRARASSRARSRPRRARSCASTSRTRTSGRACASTRATGSGSPT